MHSRFLVWGGVLGGFGVALGAFGAHGLQRITSDDRIIQGYQTGVQYQVYHALALLAIAGLFNKFNSSWLRKAGFCFIAGILLFCGSLYILTLLKIQESDATRFVGPITPLGGLFFIAGWLCLVMAGRKVL